MSKTPKEHLQEFVESWEGIIYCEYCNQGFPNHDLFRAHRMASDVPEARKFDSDGYDGFSIIQPGEASGSFEVGHKPCDYHLEVSRDE